MSSAIILFLDDVNKVNEIIASELINDACIAMMQPAGKTQTKKRFKKKSNQTIIIKKKTLFGCCIGTLRVYSKLMVA